MNIILEKVLLYFIDSFPLDVKVYSVVITAKELIK